MARRCPDTRGEVEISITPQRFQAGAGRGWARVRSSGEMALITNKPRTATVMALIDSEAYVLSKSESRACWSRRPS